MSRLNLFAALLLGVSLTALGCQQAATPEARTADKPIMEAEGDKPMAEEPAAKSEADKPAAEAAPAEAADAPAENADEAK